jgi:hypothetical protein
MGSVSWSEDGIVYLLAGELNGPRLTQLADTAQADAPKPWALNAVGSVSAPPPPPPPRPPAKR